ncbi:MAG: hypothetical protein H0X30_05270 [Anaerolineae bacterium]|nr:hypothetical protein [Anaerolineae bacterium]
MSLVLGIDGGGTNTRCLVVDTKMQVIGVGNSGASKPDAIDHATGIKHLHRAIYDACKECGIDAIDTVFVGMGGVISDTDANIVRTMLDGLEFKTGIPIGIDHDIRIALAGGLAGKQGIALIAGTGSSCYGRTSAGKTWRCGGWGYLIDDLGSGFYLGQQALMAVTQAADGRGSATALTKSVLETLGLTDLNQLMNRVYYPHAAIGAIASLAPLVLELSSYDPIAHTIVVNATKHLANLVITTAKQLDLQNEVNVVAVGGVVTSSESFRQLLEAAIKEQLPTAKLQLPVAPPVVGAAILAFEQIGLTPSLSDLNHLSETLSLSM